MPAVALCYTISEVITMQENQCKDCENYLQHYALSKRKLYRVYCGHCTRFPAKRKRPDTAACELFRSGVPDAEAFASKEYLSKELLQYLLHLELLPTIYDQE